MNDNEYKIFIDRKIPIENIYIIYIKEIMSGIVDMEKKEIAKLKFTEPIIFMKYKSVVIGNILINLFHKIFVLDKMDAVIIKIYSNNINMKNAMSIFNIQYCGKIEKGITINSLNMDIEYYQVSIQKYNDIIERFVG